MSNIPSELLDGEFLREEILYGSAAEILVNKVAEVTRWSIRYDLVFKYKGKYYSSYYAEGATEQQDEQPWEYDEPSVVEVKPVEETVTITKYVGVEKDV